MPELWELTNLIRSKNAGPFELTFDIMFKDADAFERAVSSNFCTPDSIGQIYGVEPELVKIFCMESISTIKISIPRRVPSGNIQDTDIYGGQFHSPLVRIQID